MSIIDPNGMIGLNITDNYMPITTKGGRRGDQIETVKAIVIHWTGAENAQSAMQTRNYWVNNNTPAGAHYIIGQAGEIVHAVPDNEVALHAGGWESAEQKGNQSGSIYTDKAKNLFKTSDPVYPTQPNYFTLGIEINPISTAGNFTNEAIDAAIKLTAKLLLNSNLVEGATLEERANNIVNGDILLRHGDGDVTDKQCPGGYLSTPEGWNSFKKEVAKAYEEARRDAIMYQLGYIPIMEYIGSAMLEKRYIKRPAPAGTPSGTGNTNNNVTSPTSPGSSTPDPTPSPTSGHGNPARPT